MMDDTLKTFRAKCKICTSQIFCSPITSREDLDAYSSKIFFSHPSIFSIFPPIFFSKFDFPPIFPKFRHSSINSLNPAFLSAAFHHRRRTLILSPLPQNTKYFPHVISLVVSQIRHLSPNHLLPKSLPNPRSPLNPIPHIFFPLPVKPKSFGAV